MDENKKIVIAGGNGFLGQLLVKRFIHKGYTVVNLNRQISKETGKLKLVKWNGVTQDNWVNEIEGSDVVINLVGRSVDCRYSEKNKKEILNSRIHSTRAIGEALTNCSTPPELWINASSATIYKHSITTKMDEENGIIGKGFSVDVCTNRESAAKGYQTENTRQVFLRTSMVMGNEGGVFPVLSNLVKRGLGGKQGKGSQYVSWVHSIDFVKAVEWIMENHKLSGAINCTAPTPLPNREFMKILRKEWNIPFGIPSSKFMLKIGALFLKTETELILKSRRVIPTKLKQSGFKFQFPTIQQAIQQLIHKN